MKKMFGFSLIELVIFIVVLAIIAKGILFAMINLSTGVGVMHKVLQAKQAAAMCMEWELGQRRVYGFASIANGTVTGNAAPAFCRAVAPGYTFTVTVTQAAINSDGNYKLMNITAAGAQSVNLVSLIADY